ncbi:MULTISPECIES: MMPL family transporter [unclassified Mesobacillus]|uniref:MMPL family transporter n=1 Tax=unclassified Mesobacillus TaxID=2675270 RepID=UPI00204112AA|nr:MULTISPECIES: MMPL family transporter [unclassified Mesobacillus]MCM3124402.1 MMPL family transporter [Mesobacillus sp. MER 33]MCM3234888.1 MMPL family transporter [Mesobacillus sp. MER 48]
MKILTFLSEMIRKNPMKLIILSIVAVLLFAAGAPAMKMATGNETLIEEDTKAYKDNLALEEEFGGESILVLYEAEKSEDLLTIDTVNHMAGLEKKLGSYEDIYTVISPNTMINQISIKQSEKYKEGLDEVISGLDKMGSSLTDISKKLNQNAGGQPPGGKNIEQNLNELNNGLSKMIDGQKKLSAGTAQMANGYTQMGGQLHEAALNMQKVSEQLGQSLDSNPQQQKQVQQLIQMSNQFVQLSEKMNEASVKGSKMTAIPENTIKGLNGMQQGLNSQKATFSELNKKQASQLNDLKTLSAGLSDMGSNLGRISENLETMVSYSDNMSPGLPQQQKTLDKMIYEENGDLRDLFSEVIVDEKYMLFIVKLEGNVDDSVKSEISGAIKEYLDDNKLENVETMVSGKPVLDDAIRTSMKESMQKMMGLSILFMILVLTLVFKVRWRLLPLVVILLAVVATVGLMGWLSIPMTMVSMAVFPILIGLGIDYAIQFQSRYSEELDTRGEV